MTTSNPPQRYTNGSNSTAKPLSARTLTGKWQQFICSPMTTPRQAAPRSRRHANAESRAMRKNVRRRLKSNSTQTTAISWCVCRVDFQTQIGGAPEQFIELGQPLVACRSNLSRKNLSHERLKFSTRNRRPSKTPVNAAPSLG